MCRLNGKFASYLRRVLCKTRLIFPRVNGPNVLLFMACVFMEDPVKEGDTWARGTKQQHQPLFT